MPNRPTHAGGAVFRRRGDTIEYLVVAATGRPDDWVLPKGHIGRDETPEAAAAREVAEEAGIDARVIGPIPGRVTFAAVHRGKSEIVDAVFYLMAYRDETESPPEDRARRWLPLDDALAALSFPESRDVLACAEELRLLSERTR